MSTVLIFIANIVPLWPLFFWPGYLLCSQGLSLFLLDLSFHMFQIFYLIFNCSAFLVCICCLLFQSLSLVEIVFNLLAISLSPALKCRFYPIPSLEASTVLLSNLFAGSLQDICKKSLTAFFLLKILFPECFPSVVAAMAHVSFVLFCFVFLFLIISVGCYYQIHLWSSKLDSGKCCRMVSLLPIVTSSRSFNFYFYREARMRSFLQHKKEEKMQ